MGYDNVDVAIRREASSLMDAGWSIPEIIVRLREVEEDERVPTTDALFWAEMAEDLLTPAVRQAYGWPPMNPAAPKADNPDLPF